MRLEPVSFAELTAWQHDDHVAALAAFRRSFALIERKYDAALGAALAALPDPAEPLAARAFFERHFVPHAAIADALSAPGLLTGYYEPEVDGALAPSAAFPSPLYRRPPDLINLVDEAQRGAAGLALTHARRTAEGPVPYATRSEIDAGALARLGLELVYLADAVEAFVMQVQGSGLVRLADGTALRLGYDGKNGHPYTSIGRSLIEDGVFAAEQMSLAALAAWLRADPARGRGVMQRNASFVFFKPLAAGPLGVHAIALLAGRSLAVDPSYHAIGTPIYVCAPDLRHADPAGFNRLMIAHDVGSAIRGPGRGDIFFGTGAVAGAAAGVTRHPGRLFVLLPRARADRS